MTIWDVIRRAVHLYPDDVAVIDGEARFTYAEVYDRICALGRFLCSRGIDPGDRIAILDVNSVQFYEAYFAAAGIGAVLAPVNVRLASEEIASILTDAGARLLIAAPQFAPLVESVMSHNVPLEAVLWTDLSPASPGVPSFEYAGTLIEHSGPLDGMRVDPDAVAHLYYTSGTTGRSKGVMLTHRNVTTHALGTVAELRLADTDVWGHIAPMFHLADAWATFALTMVGGRHVMLPRFDAQEALAAIERERITITNLIPTMLNLMVKHPLAGRHDYSSLRMILSGGAPIAPEVIRMIVELFDAEYCQTYGMTETSPYLTLSLLKSHLRHLPAQDQFAIRAKTGRPFITVELRVVDDAGRDVRDDESEVGEIWARGDTITPGYWNLPEETATAFTDGWLRTGDLAVRDAEGYLTIVDRKKDMIISGGENVYSTEVEHVLYRHPKILEAAVYGIPDEVFGETVRAAVVLRPGAAASAEEIITFCRRHLAGFKTPRSILFLEELPRTGSGKIMKKELRARAAGQRPAEP
jgi:acyl-CoA synthetase (AMP-forming)/AMP-acid ligase II